MTSAAHDALPSRSPAAIRAASSAEGSTSGGWRPLSLVPSKCFVCNDDDAEPVAVGQDFDCSSSPDSFLAVRCRRCGLVYLNPAPAPGELEATHLLGRDLGFEIARLRKRLGNSARVLHVRGIEDLDDPQNAYDAVLLTHVVERVDDPLSALKAIGQLLQPGGIALIVTPNTEATVCKVFQGRHWSGYNFPRHRNLFCAHALGEAARMAGLEMVSVGTVGAPEAWVESARNTMTDWNLPHWMLAALNRGWGAALMAAAAIEWWQRVRGKGGLLRATLRRPSE